MLRNFPLGSVSCATLRPEDLVPAFVDALDSTKELLIGSVSTSTTPEETEAIKADVSAIDDLLGEIEQRQQSESYYDSEESMWDMDELIDSLNNLSPPYTYFGAHDGDGADFGFWPCWDSINDATRYGDLLAVDDLADVPEDHRGLVLEQDGRGNATMWNIDDSGHYVEVWSVV